jgi:NAD(P)-dependent dehydrogenase (short-subunit alcohol dehydrogenase family)
MARLGTAVVVGARNVEAGTAVVQEVERAGGTGQFVEMHLECPEDAVRTVESAVKRFGHLDILVNNAATQGEPQPLTDLGLAEWERIIRTNLTGTFLLSQAAIRQMLAQGTGGAIINILAIQMYSPLPGFSAYSASKGGLLTLTRAMAVELADKGIRVNGISVGSVYTETVEAELRLNSSTASSIESVPEAADRGAATLLGRMGRPSEIARVVEFLASDDSSYLAGAVIPADGGRLLSRKPDPFLSALLSAESGH